MLFLQGYITLGKDTRKDIDALKVELEDKPDKARKLIQFPNNKDTKYLADTGIKDRTMVIMQANRILAKQRMT